MEKIRKQFYEYCKNYVGQENQISKLKNKNQGKISKNYLSEYEQAQDMLLKYKCQCDNYSLLYNYEISKINKIYEQNEKLYGDLYKKIKINEESRNHFVKNNLNKFSKLIEEISIDTFDFLNVISFILFRI